MYGPKLRARTRTRTKESSSSYGKRRRVECSTFVEVVEALLVMVGNEISWIERGKARPDISKAGGEGVGCDGWRRVTL
jgi:hypothetical protein